MQLFKPHIALTLLLCATALAAAGCTHMQLRRSTVGQATTLTELQYQQVLNNLAMAYCDPYVLPSLIALKSGTTQTADTGTGGILPSAETNSLIAPSLTGSRTIVEQWSTTPITDDTTLGLLSMAYRRALGFAELMDKKQANDLAHELIGQIPTTADLSLEGEVLAKILNAHAENAHPSPVQLQPKVECGKMEVRFYVPGKIGNWEAHTDESGKHLTVEGTWTPSPRCVKCKKSGCDRCELSASAKQLQFEFRDIDLPQAVAPWAGESAANVLLGEGPESILVICLDTVKTEEPEKAEWRTQGDPHLSTAEEIDARLASRQFLAVMEAINDTLDWTVLEDNPKCPPYFRPFKDWAPSAVAQEIIYEVNETQETLEGIHPGWYCVGCKRQVPSDALYVGHFRDCYVWVERGHTKELAEFTCAVLQLSGLIKDRQVVNSPSGVQFSPAIR
ncbi:MAG TPA: hypothetical protein VHY91_06350 [Pirellulales bacterium]|nr:hypothetical protein [Pirellulales bacterium]